MMRLIRSRMVFLVALFGVFAPGLFLLRMAARHFGLAL
jgi:hypothetical protein